MRHRLSSIGWALLLSVLSFALPDTGWAANWLDSNGRATRMLSTGGFASWTTAANVNSSVLNCTQECVCDATDDTDTFTVFRATKAGVVLGHDYWRVDPSKDCSDSTETFCSTVTLPTGYYIFDPVGNTASAECRGSQPNP